MGSGNIREVVLGFKGIVDNIPTQYGNFDEAFDELCKAFRQTMNELLPMKYFALCDDRHGKCINVFDGEAYCNDWLLSLISANTDNRAIYKKISFIEFVKMTADERDDLNCYSCELDRVVIKVY